MIVGSDTVRSAVEGGCQSSADRESRVVLLFVESSERASIIAAS
jgi:hypothetical protein